MWTNHDSIMILWFVTIKIAQIETKILSNQVRTKKVPLLQTVCPSGPDWLWEQHSPSRFSLYALSLICRVLEKKREREIRQFTKIKHGIKDIRMHT